MFPFVFLSLSPSFMILSHLTDWFGDVICGDSNSWRRCSRFRVTSGVLPDGLRVDEMTGEISGIPTTLVDPIDITIEVWNEVSSEEITMRLVVKLLTILAIVLICVASVIVLHLVACMTRIHLIWRDKHNTSMKTLERKQYHKMWLMWSQFSLWITFVEKAIQYVHFHFHGPIQFELWLIQFRMCDCEIQWMIWIVSDVNSH